MEEKLKVTSALLLLMLLLGTADAVLVEGMPEPYPGEVTTIAINDEDDSEPPAKPTRPTLPSVKTPTTPTPAGGVRKSQGPDVLDALINNEFTFTDTKENVLLQKVVASSQDTLQTKVLLLNGDRAGLIAWVGSPNVKKHYLVLKEALHSAFTPEVRDLLDETQRREGRPTRNLLTFFDTGLAPERIVFVRVRERLYEFHVAEGASEPIFDLIEDLTQ